MPRTPEGVLLLALQRRDDQDYHGVVALCDPSSVRGFFNRYRRSEPIPTIDEIAAERPGMTINDARRVRSRLEEMSQEDLLRRARAVPGVREYDELVALGPGEFFARWLELNDPRFEFQQRLRERGRPIPPSLLLRDFRYEAVERTESEGEALVRYREVNEGDGFKMGPLEYERLVRGPDSEWRLLVRAQLLLPRAGFVAEVPQDLVDLCEDEGRSP